MIAQSVAEIISRHVRLTVEGSTGCTFVAGARPRELRLASHAAIINGKTAARADAALASN